MHNFSNKGRHFLELAKATKKLLLHSLKIEKTLHYIIAKLKQEFCAHTTKMLFYYAFALGLKRKKKRKAAFLKIVATKQPENLVHIDKSGSENTKDYPYGYCQKSEQFYGPKSQKKAQRTSVLADFGRLKIFAPITFEGRCNMFLIDGLSNF